MTQEEPAREMAAAALVSFVAPGDDAAAVRAVVAQSGVEQDRAQRFVSAGRADLVRHAARRRNDAAVTDSGDLAERVAACTTALHRLVVMGQHAAPGQRRRTPDRPLREHGLPLGPDGLRLAGAIAQTAAWGSGIRLLPGRALGWDTGPPGGTHPGGDTAQPPPPRLVRVPCLARSRQTVGVQQAPG
jgi:hypothetical protein